MCSNVFKEQKLTELSEFIESGFKKGGDLIEVLHKAQSIFGYLPREVQKFVAKKLDIPVAKVNGVVTFYSYFNEEPSGRNIISVCMGTTCFVKGAGEILTEFEKKLGIKAGQTTSDGRFTLQGLMCVGVCAVAPVITVNEDTIGNFTLDMIDEVINKYK